MKLNKKFKFENRIIWQKAMIIGDDIDRFTESFPKKEMYNLSSQIRRAADSIALNISEGSIVQFKPEFRKFMGYSIRSLAEVVSCLYKARNRKYITVDVFDTKYEEAFNPMNMMIAFRNKI